jgi:tetratricopeptide (TPR) repeat protein
MNKNILKSIKINNLEFPTISVNIIFKNENENLKRLLPILDGAVNEVVLIDTGTKGDKQFKIIEDSLKNTEYKILYNKWDNDFSKARNLALKNSTKDYILFLDADDTINRQDISKIKEHISIYSNTYVYLHLIDKRINSILHSTQLRCFPNIEGLEWRGKVHEQIIFSLKEKNLYPSFFMEAPIIHKGYNTGELLLNKLKRNYNILREEIKKETCDFYTYLNFARTSMSLNKIANTEFALKKANDLYNDDNLDISEEYAILMYSIGANLLGSKGKHEKSLELIKELEKKYPNNRDIHLLLGEIYYKLKIYDFAYSYLKLGLEKKITISTIPIDLEGTVRTLKFYLVVCSLYMSDFKTAELNLQELLKDKKYKIQGDNKIGRN